MTLRIIQGRVIDPASDVDRITDLFVADGKIVGLDTAPSGFVPERQLNATGCLVMPGLVDLAARLREPGQEHKATIASETYAAAAGGITSLCFPP
ncbi:MAG: dihydroorotase, partial [Gammaproteobacteria bacterium]|nr:dihydroorotase [Gammaproteobacteria bacterium]